MINKRGIQIISSDEKLFGLDDVQLSQAEELQASRPVAIDSRIFVTRSKRQ